jgi:hypothetical protein
MCGIYGFLLNWIVNSVLLFFFLNDEQCLGYVWLK